MLPVDSSSRAGHYSSILQEEETETISRDAGPELVDPQGASLRFRHCLTVAVPDLIEPTSTQSDTARPSTVIDPVVDHKQLGGAAKLRGLNVLMNTDPVTEEDRVPGTTDGDPKPRGLGLLMHSVVETVPGNPQEAHQQQLITDY